MANALYESLWKLAKTQNRCIISALMFIHVVLWQNTSLLQNMKNLVTGGNGQIAGVSTKASYKYSTAATGIGAIREFVYDNHFMNCKNNHD